MIYHHYAHIHITLYRRYHLRGEFVFVLSFREIMKENNLSKNKYKCLDFVHSTYILVLTLKFNVLFYWSLEHSPPKNP